MKDYTTELDAIQQAITHAVRAKKQMNTIMIDQHYYNNEVSRAASNASDQITVLLAELRKVEIELTPRPTSCDMTSYAFLTNAEKLALLKYIKL